jgi:hypothetical protein
MKPVLEGNVLSLEEGLDMLYIYGGKVIFGG